MSAAMAYADERSAELVKSFQSFCIPGPPEFAALDAKATRMKLPLIDDQNGMPLAHTKSWLVTLNSGTHALIAGEAHGPKLDVAGCSIGAKDADGEQMKQELIGAMKLGSPLVENTTSNGASRVMTWKYAEDVSLMLADETPHKAPGILLTLIRQTKRNR